MPNPVPDFSIALAGRPNVGKSTLYNRLIGGKKAIVASSPGVTRDRREGATKIGPYNARIIDTGGVSFEKTALFSKEIKHQVMQGVKESDLVWLVMDGSEGLNPYDEELYRWLVQLGKPIMAIANKVDNRDRVHIAGEFYMIGIEHMISISALHGTGIEEALQKSIELLGLTAEASPPESFPSETDEGDEHHKTEPDPVISIAFLGRPNVGKSSLVNRIFGDSRMIVSDIAGTTREAIELPFERKGEKYNLIDTAGIRRKSRTVEHLEKVSALNAINTLRATDIAVLVLDATESIADQDAKIASYILDQKNGIVIALNKWDLIKDKNKKKEIELDVRDKLRFLSYAPIVQCSAVKGSGINKLFEQVRSAHREYSRRIQTADLNRVVQMAVLRQPPPAQGRVPTKVFYGSQIKTTPPTFCLFTNHIKEIKDSYTRYMENQLRHHFGFTGTPLTILWKGRKKNVKN